MFELLIVHRTNLDEIHANDDYDSFKWNIDLRMMIIVFDIQLISLLTVLSII
jgi:hypothetical protein